MNASRVITFLSIALLISWSPSYAMENSKRPKSKVMTPTDVQNQMKQPLPTTPEQNEQSKQAATQSSPATPKQQTASTTVQTTLGNPATQTQPEPLAQIPVVANAIQSVTNEKTEVAASSQPQSPKQQTKSEQASSQELTAYDISKVKEPVSKAATRNILSRYSKADYAVEYSANPMSVSDDDRLTGLNRGINELAENAKYYKANQANVNIVELRKMLDSYKHYNKQLTDIVTNLQKNKIQIPDVKLQQAAQTLQFVNEVYLLPYLLLVTQEVSQQFTQNVAALKVLDGLRMNKKPEWLSKEEENTAVTIENFKNNLLKYLETPAEGSHSPFAEDSK